MMPGMNGLEMLTKLRSTPNGSTLPVVVITAGGEYDIKDRVLEAGGTACLQKPINMEQLASMIQSVLTDE